MEDDEMDNNSDDDSDASDDDDDLDPDKIEVPGEWCGDLIMTGSNAMGFEGFPRFRLGSFSPNNIQL